MKSRNKGIAPISKITMNASLVIDGSAQIINNSSDGSLILNASGINSPKKENTKENIINTKLDSSLCRTAILDTKFMKFYNNKLTISASQISPFLSKKDEHAYDENVY